MGSPGASARRRRNLSRAARLWSLGLGRMAYSRISLAFAQARQSDWGGGFALSRRGGKTDDLIGEIVGQDGGDQVCQQPCSRQHRISRGQFIQSAQGLQAFEANL